MITTIDKTSVSRYVSGRSYSCYVEGSIGIGDLEVIGRGSELDTLDYFGYYGVVRKPFSFNEYIYTSNDVRQLLDDVIRGVQENGKVLEDVKIPMDKLGEEDFCDFLSQLVLSFPFLPVGYKKKIVPWYNEQLSKMFLYKDKACG